MSLSKPFPMPVLIIIGVLLASLTGLLIMSMLEVDQASSVAEATVVTTLPPPGPPTDSLVPPPTEPAAPTLTPEPGPSATIATPAEPPISQPTETPLSPTLASETPVPVLVTQTPTATLEPQNTTAPEETVINWQRIQIERPAISFEVPAEWQQLGEELAWSNDAGRTEVGLRWEETSADWHSSSMLVPPFQLVESKAVNLGWSEGHSYLIQVLRDDSPAEVQRHIIVQTGDELAYDFYASAQTLRDLATLEETLDLMLNSITLESQPGDPVEVAVQFLGSLLRGQTGEEHLSQKLKTELQNGRTSLALLGVNDLFGSYYVYWLTVTQEGDMVVQAELNYADGQVIKRVFTLIYQSGDWRIDAIAPVG